MPNFTWNVGIDLDDADDVRRCSTRDVTKNHAASGEGIIDAKGDELVPTGAI